MSLLAVVALCACGFRPKNNPAPLVQVVPTRGATVTFTLQPSPTITGIPSATPTTSPSATLTPSPSTTPSVTPTGTTPPTPTWVYARPERVVAPILLYHHVDEPSPADRYHIPPADFRLQMETLDSLGYTTITPTLLVKVLVGGGLLPERPVVLTFDDGSRSVYENAFPAMQEHGFVGSVFIVTDRIGSGCCMSASQLRELLAAGWEVGSHGKTHAQLTDDEDLLELETIQSRLDLEATLGISITTFAYPYGVWDDTIELAVREAEYRGAFAVGFNWYHLLSARFHLFRIDVRGDLGLDDFLTLLPWNEPLATPGP